MSQSDGGDEDGSSLNGCESDRKRVIVKVACIGDASIDFQNIFKQYIKTDYNAQKYIKLGNKINFWEVTIGLENCDVILSMWHCDSSIFNLAKAKNTDNEGSSSSSNSKNSNDNDTLLNLVIKDAHCIVFGFNLNDINSLKDIKQWYKICKKYHKNDNNNNNNNNVKKEFIPILIGTQYNVFDKNENIKYKKMIYQESIKYAIKMKSSLVYISSKSNINVKKLLKMIVTHIFELKPNLKESKNKALFLWNANGVEIKLNGE